MKHGKEKKNVLSLFFLFTPRAFYCVGSLAPSFFIWVKIALRLCKVMFFRPEARHIFKYFPFRPPHPSLCRGSLLFAQRVSAARAKFANCEQTRACTHLSAFPVEFSFPVWNTPNNCVQRHERLRARTAAGAYAPSCHVTSKVFFWLYYITSCGKRTSFIAPCRRFLE